MITRYILDDELRDEDPDGDWVMFSNHEHEVKLWMEREAKANYLAEKHDERRKYWKARAQRVEERNDDLVKTINRLKRGRTWAEIKAEEDNHDRPK